MTARAALKASDGDREQIAAHLHGAAAEGRLLAEELEHRLGLLFAARTYGELDALVSDLPAPLPPPSERRLQLRPLLAAAVALALVLVVLVAVGLTVRGHSSMAAPNQVAAHPVIVSPTPPPAASPSRAP